MSVMAKSVSVLYDSTFTKRTQGNYKKVIQCSTNQIKMNIPITLHTDKCGWKILFKAPEQGNA